MSGLPQDIFSFPANRLRKTASGMIKFTRELSRIALVINTSLKAFFWSLGSELYLHLIIIFQTFSTWLKILEQPVWIISLKCFPDNG